MAVPEGEGASGWAVPGHKGGSYQALAALLFLYERVLGRQLNWLDGVVHAKRPERLPPVPVAARRPSSQR